MIVTTDYFTALYDTLHGHLPFYGSGIEESLERIPEDHFRHPVGHRTIDQLCAHMLAWRYDLIRRLHGEPREKIEIDSPQDWPETTGLSKAEIIIEFNRTKERLQAGIRQFDPAAMSDKLHPDYEYTNVQLLEGGAHHDIYHLGQINLIASFLKNDELG